MSEKGVSERGGRGGEREREREREKRLETLILYAVESYSIGTSFGHSIVEEKC